MVVGEPVTMTCAGRTDRGVHARAQVVTFDAPETDLPRLHRSLNKMGGGRIVVREVARVGSDVDARFSATWRLYRYSVRNSPVPDPFTRDVAWWVDEPLSLPDMNLAVQALVGQHDFAAFCRAPKPTPGAAIPPSLIRRVIEARWTEVDDENLRFEIRATAFCHQMVRSIVGLLVDVGRGAIAGEAVAGILARGERSGVPALAPPHGLCLWDVGY
jgi:tRNA pseudouridine38-40 synthase